MDSCKESTSKKTISFITIGGDSGTEILKLDLTDETVSDIIEKIKIPLTHLGLYKRGYSIELLYKIKKLLPESNSISSFLTGDETNYIVNIIIQKKEQNIFLTSNLSESITKFDTQSRMYDLFPVNSEIFREIEIYDGYLNLSLENGKLYDSSAELTKKSIIFKSDLNLDILLSDSIESKIHTIFDEPELELIISLQDSEKTISVNIAHASNLHLTVISGKDNNLYLVRNEDTNEFEINKLNIFLDQIVFMKFNNQDTLLFIANLTENKESTQIIIYDVNSLTIVYSFLVKLHITSAIFDSNNDLILGSNDGRIIFIKDGQFETSHCLPAHVLQKNVQGYIILYHNEIINLALSSKENYLAVTNKMETFVINITDKDEQHVRINTGPESLRDDDHQKFDDDDDDNDEEIIEDERINLLKNKKFIFFA